MNSLLPAWTDFLIVADAIILVALAALVWVVFFCKRPWRRIKTAVSSIQRLRKSAACRRCGMVRSLPVNRSRHLNRDAPEPRNHPQKRFKSRAAFLLLPRAKRDAMSALYAFCREVDDVADNESMPAEKRLEQLALWRADIRRACAARFRNLQ